MGLDELAVEACGRTAVNVQPEISTGHPITKATTGEFQMLEVITNPILGGMIATFSIGMAFTIWSTVSDWMWDRKNK
ncbi:hypothetical protein [Citrobacter freundii]|uniref:hypothetical protein n=1 Tax=Citrobacter freundii TaxID=546 RepID=UPI00388FE93D|nr:hypothetical protein [Citrobacter freundii]